MKRLVASLSAVVLGLTLVWAVPGAAASGTRDKWDTRVFSNVPYPGTPAYVFVHTNGRVYAGTYDAGTKTPSRVFEWTSGGTLLRSWTVPGQDLAHHPGIQVANQDARGRLVLLEKSTSAVMTLDLKTGRFKRQATLPDLPLCSTKVTPCSPNSSDSKAIPNYAAWGPDGALYITDYGQAVIWRLPATGGTPKVWFGSKALDNVLGFGTTGLVYQPSSKSFLITQQTVGSLLANAPSGRLYALPISAGGKPGTLKTLWTSRPAELPDGFGIGRSGKIYVANVGPLNQLVVLSPTGKELERFPKFPLTGANGSPVPFDGASNATFLGTRVLVANQSPISKKRAHHVILDVEVGERGIPNYLPKGSTLR
ncbi:SMP-30/gluconolactonase/LRE family protein [Aeromicrobium sp.]|uniref:SMP-30/gluconolactonase/LRE family protein n=1 Tax=Aeromicrobium sp. TaxID=1871063 RepID=UPI002FC5F738